MTRSRDELTEAWTDRQTGHDRFGPVTSVLDPIAAPRPPWAREA